MEGSYLGKQIGKEAASSKSRPWALNKEMG